MSTTTTMDKDPCPYQESSVEQVSEPAKNPQSEGDNVQLQKKESKRGKSPKSPKTSQSTLLACRLEYESGSWKSLTELGNKYGIHVKTLYGRIVREKWDQKRKEILRKVEARAQNMVMKEVDQSQEYLRNAFKRALRLEKITDASLSQASLTNDGTPLVDLDQVDVLTRAELRIHELAKSALRIIPVSQVDHTSNGQSLGDSFVSAIAKLRADANTPNLSQDEVDKVIEAEVIDESKP